MELADALVNHHTVMLVVNEPNEKPSYYFNQLQYLDYGNNEATKISTVESLVDYKQQLMVYLIVLEENGVIKLTDHKDDVGITTINLTLLKNKDYFISTLTDLKFNKKEEIKYV